MRKIFISAVIGILFLCSGCIPYHAVIHRAPDEKTLTSIKKGFTNKADILMMLGEPDRVMEKERFFQYWWHEDHGIALGYFGGPIRSTYSLHIYFNENNIVKEFEIKEKGISIGGERHPDKFLLELYAGKYVEMGVPDISEIELKKNGKGVWRVPGNETSFRWSIGDNEIRMATRSEVIIGQIIDDILEIPLPAGLSGRYFKRAK